VTDSDLRFIEAEGPLVDEPDDAATARARAALMEHVALTSRPKPLPQRVARRPRRVLGTVRLAAVGLATAAAIAAVLTLGAGGTTPATLRVDNAQAAPLVRLSTTVAHSTPPPGDATLVIRRQTYPNAPEIDGADLYADDGRYFYSAERSGLAAAVKGNEDVGDGFMKRELDAALAALTLPADQARTRMADAALDPRIAAMTPAEREKQAERQRQRLLADPNLSAAAKAKLNRGNSAEAVDPQTIEDNHVWTNCLDVLIAGAGQPDVRAGVLKLFSTMPTIEVSRTPLDGHDALDIVSHAFGGGYQEELLIDAHTGTPLRFIGRQQGQAPSVVVTYEVSRVTLADIAAGE
jgi:hypothetical protein